MAEDSVPEVNASLLNLFQNIVPLNQQNQHAVNELRARAVTNAIRDQNKPREDTEDDDFMAAAGDAISETDRPRRDAASDDDDDDDDDNSQRSSNNSKGSSKGSSVRSGASRTPTHNARTPTHNSDGHEERAETRRAKRIQRLKKSRGFRDAMYAIVDRYKQAGAQPGALKVSRPFVADPDEAERRELWMQIEELRLSTKMEIIVNRDAPCSELSYVLQRYTEMISRNNDVTLALNVIAQVADTIEALNRASGPWLPLDGYGNTVRSATQQPQFRYAVYRMLLKYRGANSFSPVREIAIALLLPILKAVVDAILNWAARGNAALGQVASQVQGAAHAAMTFAVGTNPDAHIPSTAPDVIYPQGRPEPSHPVFAHDDMLDGPLMTGPADDVADLADALAGIQGEPLVDDGVNDGIDVVPPTL